MKAGYHDLEKMKLSTLTIFHFGRVIRWSLALNYFLYVLVIDTETMSNVVNQPLIEKIHFGILLLIGSESSDDTPNSSSGTTKLEVLDSNSFKGRKYSNVKITRGCVYSDW